MKTSGQLLVLQAPGSHFFRKVHFSGADGLENITFNLFMPSGNGGSAQGEFACTKPSPIPRYVVPGRFNFIHSVNGITTTHGHATLIKARCTFHTPVCPLPNSGCIYPTKALHGGAGCFYHYLGYRTKFQAFPCHAGFWPRTAYLSYIMFLLYCMNCRKRISATAFVVVGENICVASNLPTTDRLRGARVPRQPCFGRGN